VHEANAITYPVKRKAPPIGRGFPVTRYSALAVLLAALLTTLSGTVLRITLLLLAGLLLPAALLLAGFLAGLIALLLLTRVLVGVLILVHFISFQRWTSDAPCPNAVSTPRNHGWFHMSLLRYRRN
jgi:hypothetical protein